MPNNLTLKTDYLKILLRAYYPLHFFALFRAHELYNVEPFIQLLYSPILDLGCGDGTIAKILFGSPLDHGIDLSTLALKKARETKAYKITLYGDAHALPLEDNSCGGIFSNCVLEHISETPALIMEISRVLKSGAYFVATCLSPLYYAMNPLFNLFDKPGLRQFRQWMITAENDLHNHVSVFNIEEYRQMFEAHGMILEKHKYYATASISRFCNKWDTASKYRIPFSLKLSHNGLLVKYLQLRYYILADKEAVINKWYADFKDICYDRNEANQTGMGQILVAKKL